MQDEPQKFILLHCMDFILNSLSLWQSRISVTVLVLISVLQNTMVSLPFCINFETLLYWFETSHNTTQKNNIKNLSAKVKADQAL